MICWYRPYFTIVYVPTSRDGEYLPIRVIYLQPVCEVA